MVASIPVRMAVNKNPTQKILNVKKGEQKGVEVHDAHSLACRPGCLVHVSCIVVHVFHMIWSNDN